MDRNIFDNHALFSQYLSVGGMRVSEVGTKPSIYITEIKLKRTVKEMSTLDLDEIYKPDTPFTDAAANHKRQFLLKKVEVLQEWQLLKALHLLVEIGRIECVAFIAKCKRTDKENK